MNRYITDRMKKTAPYEPNEAIYETKLDANENNLPLSGEIKEKLKEALAAAPINRYPDPMSTDVCRRYGELMGVDGRNIVAGSGSDELISVIVNFFCEPNDRVLTFSPDFSMYSFYASIKGADCVTIKKGDDMELSAAHVIEAADRYKPRLIMFSNPCNPTGLGLSAPDIMKIVKNVDSIVICDEAYMDFWDQSVINKAPNSDNLIVLRTCSKAFGMAGGRLGFAIACEELINEIKKAKSPYNLNVLTQTAALVMLNHEGDIRRGIADIIETRKYLQNRLSELSEKSPVPLRIFESRANFIFMHTPAAEKIDKALKEAGIIIRSYPDGYLRVSVGTADEIKAFLTVFEGALLGSIQ